MTKSDSPKYEAPRAARLADAANALGSDCNNGDAASSCYQSGSTDTSCGDGNNAYATCEQNGNTAYGCRVGTGARIGGCTNGGDIQAL